MTHPIEEKTAIQIVALYQEGHTVLAIAAQFSISYNRVYAVLHKKRIPMRKRGGLRKRKALVIEEPLTPAGKYDYINFEPRAQGMNYQDYLKRYNIKYNKCNWS